MENRIYHSQTASLGRSQSSQKLKFKEITTDNTDFNELNSKYELYKRGTPNVFTEDLTALRAKNIKGNVAMIELPAIDTIVGHLQGERQGKVNQRNYELYPTLLKQGKTRYKQMLSEKQEIRDFIVWFQGQFQAVDQSTDPNSKKFQNKQTLIAAGFNQMVGQIAKTSKNRAEIIKMLWNRQSHQVGDVIDLLNSQGVRKQRSLLEQISQLHAEYQRQIDSLRRGTRDLQQSSRKEQKFNRTLIENLRVLRKRMRKLEYLVKKLSESNLATKKQNLNLIQQNIKLLMSIKQVTEEEAVILNYRRLQVYEQKERLRQHRTKKVLALAQVAQDESAPLQQLDDKKKALYQYFLQRLKQNPDERIFIKEDYFSDEEQNVNTIEDYFKTIINRPNIKMELVNEEDPMPSKRDRAVNTDFHTEIIPNIISLQLEKGVQVQLDPHIYSLKEQGEISRDERKVYQMISHREQQQMQKQSKKRIVQHRISRKNSLTLLEIQSLSEMNSKLYSRKGPLLSSIGKKSRFNDSIDDTHKHLDAIDSEIQSLDQSQAESEGQLLAVSKGVGKESALTTINIDPNIVNQRKSLNFQNLLQKISENLPREPTVDLTDKFIRLDQEAQQEIKYSQLEDLISKHLAKNQETKPVQNPEKYLNKLLLSVYKNLALKKQYAFVFELLEVIKTNYGNTKSVIWKFLNIVSIIRNYSNAGSLLKIVSLFLKVNQKFKLYDEVNREELSEIYFRLFFLLTIKGVNQTSFNLWKACTSLQKIRGTDFPTLLDEYFSRKKRIYIEGKIQELAAASQLQIIKKGQTRKQDIGNVQIVKLNPILLYVLEVYLIEKELYHSSYSEMVEFITTEGHISVDFLIWLIDFLGFPEEKQNQMLGYIYAFRSNSDGINSSRPVQKTLRNDFFYKFSVKFDLPLLEQLSVTTYARFKLLPEEIQQKYFRMIGVEEWGEIRSELIRGYRATAESQIYSKAFLLILDRLEYQIKKGASIYGEDYYPGRAKRKEQVFSLFYKIVIIQAHKSLLRKPRLAEERSFHK